MNQPEEHETAAESRDHAETVAPTGPPAEGGARIEPITPPQAAPPDAVTGPAESAAPAAPAEPPIEAGFEADGEKWIARPAGVGSYGTGITARASILAIHFFRYAEPDRPVREVLTSTGRFDALYDEELRDLLARSRPVVER